jgi:hypothetical protein
MRSHHLCLLKTVAVQEVNRNAGRAKGVAANRGENIDVVNAPQRDVPLTSAGVTVRLNAHS